MIPKKDSKKEIIVNVIICAVAGTILLLLASFRAFAPLDNRIYDAFLELSAAGRIEAENLGIVLLKIDEESLTETGKRWPWDRRLFAKAVNYLSEAGAKAIGIDLLFIEESADPQADKILAEAMKKAGNVVIASKLERMERSFSGGDVGLSGIRLILPLLMFRQAAATGLVNVEYSSGSVVREFKPYYHHQGECYPTFTVELYAKAFGKMPDIPNTASSLIAYSGKPGDFPSVPIYQALNGSVGKETFAGKIVLIGAAFSDAHDFFSTPLSSSSQLSSGVEIQANIFGTLIKNSRIEFMSLTSQLVIIIALTALAGYLAMFRSAYFFLAACVLSFTFISSLCLWLLYKHGIFMDVSYPLLAIPLTFFLVSLRIRKPLVLETKIGPYILHEELGRGGMAVVYRATHPRTGEEVALKQLLPQFSADEETIHRFLMETELLQQLDHPNIVRIIDAGDVDQCPYYAMELIKGPSLKDVLKEKGRLNNTEVRHIGAAVAMALARAHQAGVIHRDIKPSNIMLTTTGIPKLTDFGIAKRLNSSHLTRTGFVIGTPDFMPPEHCRGETSSAAADVYSFGATLYAMIVGRPPFCGDNIHAVMNMIITDAPKDIRALSMTVEDDVARLVMKCLAKNPDERPSDMIELAKILDPYYADAAMKTTVAINTPSATSDRTLSIQRP